MHIIDLLVVGLYVTAVLWFGARYSRDQRSSRDYFLTRNPVPWWALLGSIVATETSTVTLISVPGYAFGGDLTFLQLALGYVVARVLVAVVLVPVFLSGRQLTAYMVMTARFGATARHVTAALFLGTRTLSDGFRLFATGLVLAAVLGATPAAVKLVDLALPGPDAVTSLLVVSIVVIAGTTVVYTLFGGMSAVIWTDVVQLVVYLGGALATSAILLEAIPGGWREVLAVSSAAGKLRVIDLSVDLSRSYTFWSGLVGGLFIATATHGADQLFVQRYLCSRSLGDARRALIVSGVVVFVQFALFLAIGLMLWVYYTEHAPDALAAITVGGQVQTDRVLPVFLMTHLPLGLRGLMVAAIVAAAMSTLSSSLNSSAASTVGDFYEPLTAGTRSEDHYLWVSRWTTVLWAIVQVFVALVAIGLSRRVVDEVLGIQSFTGGLLLGALSLAVLTTRSVAAAPVIGIACGAGVLLVLRVATDVSWQWYALIGSLSTFGVGLLVMSLHARVVFPRRSR